MLFFFFNMYVYIATFNKDQDSSLAHATSHIGAYEAFQNEVSCVKSKGPKCGVVSVTRLRPLLKVAMVYMYTYFCL